MEASLARFSRISPALKRRAAQVALLLMDVAGTMTDGGVTLLSQTDGTALEIKTFNAHDGQGLTLAHTAGLRTGCITGRESRRTHAPGQRNENGIHLHETTVEDAGL